jgi:response regulator RpfG family c-di-GMP phosphodiesterase
VRGKVADLGQVLNPSVFRVYLGCRLPETGVHYLAGVYLTGAEQRRLAMLRILIADDHDIVRSGLRTVIEAQADWEVVAEASNGKDAVSKALETKPDVAVLDYSMPLINALTQRGRSATACPRQRSLFSPYTTTRCSSRSCCVRAHTATS